MAALPLALWRAAAEEEEEEEGEGEGEAAVAADELTEEGVPPALEPEPEPARNPGGLPVPTI